MRPSEIKLPEIEQYEYPGEFGSFSDHYQNEVSPYQKQSFELRTGGSFGVNIIDVTQAAVEATDPGMREYAIVAGVSGHGYGEIDFGDGWRKRQFTSGWVDLQPANQECHFRVPDLRLRCLFIEKLKLDYLLDEAGASSSTLNSVSGEFKNLPNSFNLMTKIWNVSDRLGASGTLLLDGLMIQLAGELIGACDYQIQGISNSAIADLRLTRAIDFIETNLGLDLNVAAIAKTSGMSVTQFSRSFSAAKGQSVWTYVQERRCKRALILLQTTDASITKIAIDCGFSSQSHLTNSMRQRFGYTPGQVREQ